MTDTAEQSIPLVDRLDHWREFFTGDDYEHLTVVDDLEDAIEAIGGRPENPTATEGAAVMLAVVAYAEHTGRGEAMAHEMPELLDALIDSARKLRRITT